MTMLVDSLPDVLDALLEQLQRRREHVLAAAPCIRRAIALAELYEREARVWSLLFERSRSRIQWRAALAAEAYARACARAWRVRANAYRCSTGICRNPGLNGAWS